MKRLVLVDGRHFCYRAHYAYHGLEYEGQPTSVLYGALFMMLSIAKSHDLASATWFFCFDGRGKTWRHKLDPVYKAQRHTDSDALVALEQIPAFKDILKCLGIGVAEVPCFEADDLIGIISLEAKKQFDKIIILS